MSEKSESAIIDTEEHEVPIWVESENVEHQEKFGYLDVCESYGLAEWEFVKRAHEVEPDKWVALADEVISKHPALESYEQIFVSGVNELISAHSKVEKIWNEAKEKHPGHSREEKGFRDKKVYEWADAEMSKSIAIALGMDRNGTFEFSGSIKAQKGAFTITLYLKKEDYDKLHPAKNGFKSQGIYDPNAPVPTIHVRDAYWILPKIAVRQVVAHEAQHARHDTMIRGYKRPTKTWYRDFVAGGFYRTPLFEKLLANMDDEDKETAQFKDEISSMMMNIALSDFRLTAQGKPIEAERFRQKVASNITRYKRDYLGKYYETPDVSDELRSAFDVAPDLLTSIREHLIRDRNLNGYDADNVAMRMLHFIPVKSWSTVNKIITKRYNSNGISDSRAVAAET